jgi:hypothetical protein
VTSHHLTLENFTREFTMSDGTRLSVSFRNTMGSSLTREVPSLHSTGSSLTFGSALYIDQLSDGEMSGSEAVANRQEGFRGDLEFSKVVLGGEVVFHEVTDLRFLDLVRVSASDTDLNSVNSILFQSFNLSDLASIYLNDRARDSHSPFIPVMSHAHLVANQTSSLTFVSRRFGLFEAKVSVNFCLKTAESVKA